MTAAFARSSFSRILIPWYVRYYKINTEDAQKNLKEFSSLLDFFCRTLKPEARLVTDASIISPVDGTVSELGRIECGHLLQAKGCSYSIEALLGDVSLAQGFQHGSYITLYLSPRDYHRIHMPMDGVVKRWRYIPGRLFPVNRHGVQLIPGLYTKNERVVTELETSLGDMVLVKVGATIVGSIQTTYGAASPKVLSRHRRRSAAGRAHIAFNKGQEIGHFEFGSTVIMLFKPGIADSFCVTKGQFVKMGDALVR